LPKIFASRAIAYEKSPYFINKTIEQTKTIKSLEQELERLFLVFQRLYEDSVTDKTIRSADIQGLLRHLVRVRTVSQERLSDIIRERGDYQANESYDSIKFQRYHMLHECKELTSQMLAEMVDRALVDLDGVRIIDTQGISSS
jgi:hypothetical protein